MADIHTINIATGGQSVWPISVHMSNIRDYSRGLAAAVDRTIQASGGTVTTIYSTDVISRGTLRFLLKSFEARESLSTEYKRFDDLVELAVALWEFECSTELFASFAKAFRPSDWNHDEGNRNTLDWAFVAFVFGWDDIFGQTTKEIIVAEKDPRIWQSARAEILDLDNERRALLRKSHKFIRDAFLNEVVGHHLSTVWIIEQLKKENINIRQPEDDIPDFNNRSLPQPYLTPQEMLSCFEKILKSPPTASNQQAITPPASQSTSHSSLESQERAQSPQSPHPYRSVGTTASKVRGQGSRSGDFWHGLALIFRPKAHQSPSRWSKEDRKKWIEIADNTLIPEIDTFRQRHFNGLHLANFDAKRQSKLLF